MVLRTFFSTVIFSLVAIPPAYSAPLVEEGTCPITFHLYTDASMVAHVNATMNCEDVTETYRSTSGPVIKDPVDKIFHRPLYETILADDIFASTNISFYDDQDYFWLAIDLQYAYVTAFYNPPLKGLNGSRYETYGRWEKR